MLSCRQDLDFVVKMIDKTAIERLEQVASTPFMKLSYTEAIEQLEKAVQGGHTFEFPVSHTHKRTHTRTRKHARLPALSAA